MKSNPLSLVIAVLVGMALSSAILQADVYGIKLGRDGESRTRYRLGTFPDQGIDWESRAGLIHFDVIEDEDGTHVRINYPHGNISYEFAAANVGIIRLRNTESEDHGRPKP